jgi:hypothetical protein
MTLAITTRRRFVALLPLSGLAVLAACSKSPDPATTTTPPAAAPAPTPAPSPAPAAPTLGADAPMVDETDATAASLGYVAVAARADAVRFPAFAEGKLCSNCALYQGAAGSVAGGCPIFVGRRVAAGGWCSSWAKKA